MWIFEQPLYIVIFAAIGGAVLGGALLQTGKHLFLYLLVAWIALAGIALGCEYAVVTENEKIEAVIYDVAAALEANDVDAVKSYISDDAPEVQNVAQRQMAYVEIQNVKLKNNLEINIVTGSTPIMAVAKLNVKIEGRVKGNADFQGDFATFLVLTLQKDPDDQWRIVSYDFYDHRGEQAGQIVPPISAAIVPGF